MAQKQAATTPAKPLWGSIDPSLREATPASDPSTSELAFGAAGAAILRSTYSKTAVIATLADLELKTRRLREENETLRHNHTVLKKNYEDTMAKYSGEMEHLKARVIAGELKRKRAEEERAIEDSGDESDEKVEVLSDGERDAYEKSISAMKSAVMKSLVRSVYEHLMGTGNLLAKNLPLTYENSDGGPVDESSKRPLLRFQFSEHYSHPNNNKGIRITCDFIKKKGAEYSPSAASEIRNISDSDLETMVVAKYKALQKSLRQAGLLRGVKAEGVAGVDNAETEVPKRSKATVQSRQKGKLDVRTRKHNSLPEDSEYRKDKYNAAMTYTLMSEDEDELLDTGAKTGRYLSRAPLYRSELLIDFLNSVDKCIDPTPGTKYTIRVPGPIIDMPPPTSQKLENRARRWMVAQEWLAKPENKVYDIPSRILDNGKAWGDEHDPEELINKAKEIAAAKKEIRDGKRVKLEMMEAAVSAKGDVKGKAKAKGGKAKKGKAKKGKKNAVVSSEVAIDDNDDEMDDSDTN